MLYCQKLLECLLYFSFICMFFYFYNEKWIIQMVMCAYNIIIIIIMHVIKFKHFVYHQKKFKQSSDLFLQSVTTNIVL